MAITRVFRSGDDQEMAYDCVDIDLTIERYGDVIVIAPVRESLREMVAAIRALPKPPRLAPREPIELPERDW